MAVGALTYYSVVSPAMVCVAVSALTLAGWRFFVPVDFKLDDGGLQQQWLGRRRYGDWSSFCRFSSLAHGFLLWPQGDCCPLDAARSLFLPCSSNRANLEALLRRHLVETP